MAWTFLVDKENHVFLNVINFTTQKKDPGLYISHREKKSDVFLNAKNFTTHKKTTAWTSLVRLFL